jgi:transposase
MTEYSEAFKANMVKKLLVPGGPTASALSIRTGICQPTLSRWLRDAREEGMSPSKPPQKVARRPSEWKPEEKGDVPATVES